MDVRYDAAAARLLIEQMEQYCADLQRNGQDLVTIIGYSEQWHDRQYDAFCNEIRQMFKDLNDAMAEQKAYIEAFKKRVQELE